MNILLLVHRLPYPPNKGDKVRSYHLLKHLAAQHRVFLGTFIDDPADEPYLDTVRALCAGSHIARLNPRSARLASLRGLLSGEALSLPYYRNAGLKNWVHKTTASEQIDAVVVFSSTMAQYAPEGLPMLVDFVDLDSAKWTDYGRAHRWPLSWLYRREGTCLLAFEAAVAEHALCAFFVTEKEVALFRESAPQSRAAVEALCNGVDTVFFAPNPARPSPYAEGQLALVFTGAMDYWPNADAVQWFAAEVWPQLHAAHPHLRFYIVGRSPSTAVQALAQTPGIVVTGTVDDVRPYLQYAAAVVAPLRLARGVQNKILEAMAMARPVVAASSCVGALDVIEGSELLAATSAGHYEQALTALLVDAERAARIGQAARQRVVRSYAWDAHLAGLDRYLTVQELQKETLA